MKKILLAVVFLLISTALVAQSNTATTTQTGDDNSAKTEQIGTTNNATINQIGNENLVGKLAEPSAKGVLQVGTSNILTIDQTGDRNKVSQFRPDHPPADPTIASVEQNGLNNQMYITQSGNDQVIGEGSFPYDGIDQLGNNNFATLDQFGGNENKIGIFYQENDGNTADIDQVGNNNYIKSASQKKQDNISPLNNNLNILQQGDYNIIHNAGERGDNIIGDILQDGDRNQATMQLTHSFANGDIDQIGDDNKATVTINLSYIGDNNSGVIYQNGDFNIGVAKIGQSNSATTSTDNTMDIEQLGDFNEADILVEGSFNDADIYQNGMNNIADIIQTGNSNVGSITSNGNGHSGTITQTGGMNNAVITQNN